MHTTLATLKRCLLLEKLLLCVFNRHLGSWKVLLCSKIIKGPHSPRNGMTSIIVDYVVWTESIEERT